MSASPKIHVDCLNEALKNFNILLAVNVQRHSLYPAIGQISTKTDHNNNRIGIRSLHQNLRSKIWITVKFSRAPTLRSSYEPSHDSNHFGRREGFKNGLAPKIVEKSKPDTFIKRQVVKISANVNESNLACRNHRRDVAVCKDRKNDVGRQVGEKQCHTGHVFDRDPNQGLDAAKGSQEQSSKMVKVEERSQETLSRRNMNMGIELEATSAKALSKPEGVLFEDSERPELERAGRNPSRNQIRLQTEQLINPKKAAPPLRMLSTRTLVEGHIPGTPGMGVDGHAA
ncbi:hypothetical protein C8R45DRAFT_1084305 [Mycena sanguinolenta]|nr:hypothetical protein C8R45DRAFT_1084305 [Mycena sanguinolenta]